MRLADLVAREAGVGIESVMLLRHAGSAVNRLRARGVTVEDYTVVQPIGSKYDYRDPRKLPILILVVIVGNAVHAVYRITGVEREGTTYTLETAAQRQINIDDQRAERPARRFSMSEFPSVSTGKRVSGWDGRQRTTVQRSDGSFFNEIEVDVDGSSPTRYKHGDKRTWELALEAISSLGGAATPPAILKQILTRFPDYVETNLSADLSMLSVNSLSRGQYSQNAKPRRTDSQSEVDKLFKRGTHALVSYELYAPSEHGVWELYLPDGGRGDSKCIVRLVNDGAVEKDFAVADEIVHNPGGNTKLDPANVVLAADVTSRIQYDELNAALDPALDFLAGIHDLAPSMLLETDDGNGRDKKVRARALRSDATVGYVRKAVERAFGLPEGSVALRGPDKKPLRSNATIGTLRQRWE